MQELFWSLPFVSAKTQQQGSCRQHPSGNEEIQGPQLSKPMF